MTPEPILPRPFAPAEQGEQHAFNAVDILRDLSDQEIEAVVSDAPTWTAGRGTVFYEAKDGPKTLFLLKSGRIGLYRRSPEGKRLTLAIIEHGTFFGEMSIVSESLSGTFATAIEDSVVCSLSRSAVQSLMLNHPKAAVRIVEVLARRLQQTRDALEEMAFSDVTGRVAGLLLRLVDEETNVIEGYSHQDLADMVGCLRESFTVTLDRFKRTGAVEIGRKRIEITDRAQFQRVVRPGPDPSLHQAGP